MATEAGRDEAPSSTPDEVFSVLGDETRLGILHTLAQADGPCAFSELYDASGYDDPSNFNYHLDKLVGQFVRKSDDGYVLYETGAQVVEAMLSGTMTTRPRLERTPVERPCPGCGGPIAVSYSEGHVWVHCAECSRERENSSSLAMWQDQDDDVASGLSLPPAGVHEREPEELLRAAELYATKEAHAVVRGICPSCAARVELSVETCDDHDVSDGRCDACEREKSAMLRSDCTNCIMGGTVTLTVYLLRSVDLLEFMAEHGIDPVAPDHACFANFDETIIATDPFEARYTFTANDDSLTLIVDDELSVVTASRG